MVAATPLIRMVLSSVAETRLSSLISSSRLSLAEAALKLVKLRPETVIWSPAAKSEVTSRTRVPLASSYVTVVETLAAAPPPITAVVSDASQSMLKPAGMRMRMSLAALI